MTTIHSYTGDQPTLDTLHKDLYRGPRRGAVHHPDHDRRRQSGRPRHAGAEGQARRRRRSACRRRTSRVVDFKFVAKRETTSDEVNNAIIDAVGSRTVSRASSAITDDKPSLDGLQPRPAVLDFALDQTKVIDGNFVRVSRGTTTNGASRTAWPIRPSRWRS